MDFQSKSIVNQSRFSIDFRFEIQLQSVGMFFFELVHHPVMVLWWFILIVKSYLLAFFKKWTWKTSELVLFHRNRIDNFTKTKNWQIIFEKNKTFQVKNRFWIFNQNHLKMWFEIKSKSFPKKLIWNPIKILQNVI